MCMVGLPIYMYKTKKIKPPNVDDVIDLTVTAGHFVVVGLLWPISILFVMVSEMIRFTVKSNENEEQKE